MCEPTTYTYKPDSDVPIKDGLFNGENLACPDCGNVLVLRVELTDYVRISRAKGSEEWWFHLAGLQLNDESAICLECRKCGWME